MISLLIGFLVWLPLAVLLHTVVNATPGDITHLPRKVLYYALVAPALLSHWLLAVVNRNDKTVQKLTRVGDWFKKD